MRFLLHVPLPRGTTRGNWITAMRWANILRTLGHHVRIVDPKEFLTTTSEPYDTLIALHARRSARAIQQFRSRSPKSQIIVALTGTDIHVDLASDSGNFALVMQSLKMANRIVLLEAEGIKLLAPQFRSKCAVIYQSSEASNAPRLQNPEFFSVSFLAHLRAVKDPFLITNALKLLPPKSRIHVHHAGQATTDDYRRQAMEQTDCCPRYDWVGPIEHTKSLELLANSRLTILTSHHEGAPSVFSEAAAHGIPILSTRITASLGILGRNHPGLFTPGNAKQLAALLIRAESDRQFYDELCIATEALKERLSPKRELHSWKALISQLPI